MLHCQNFSADGFGRRHCIAADWIIREQTCHISQLTRILFDREAANSSGKVYTREVNGGVTFFFFILTSYSQFEKWCFYGDYVWYLKVMFRPKEVIVPKFETMQLLTLVMEVCLVVTWDMKSRNTLEGVSLAAWHRKVFKRTPDCLQEPAKTHNSLP